MNSVHLSIKNANFYSASGAKTENNIVKLANNPELSTNQQFPDCFGTHNDGHDGDCGQTMEQADVVRCYCG
jgi:hypothetical protein